MKRIGPALLITLLSLAAMPAAVRGVVMTRDGAPLAKATVSGYAVETVAETRARLRSETPSRVPIAGAETDACGAFALAFDAPVADLQVEAKGFAPYATRVLGDEEIGFCAMKPAAVRDGAVRAGTKRVAGARVVWSGASGAEVVAVTDDEGNGRTMNVAHPASHTEWRA